MCVNLHQITRCHSFALHHVASSTIHSILVLFIPIHLYHLMARPFLFPVIYFVIIFFCQVISSLCYVLLD